MKRRASPIASPGNARGFTLLEAIVGMVVFTMGAFALYGWLSTNMITLDRIRQRQQIDMATHSALDVVRRSNPMEAPSGRREVGDLTISWTATLLEPIKSGSDQGGGATLFVVGLYDLHVRVHRDGREVQAFHVRQAGWKQVRSGIE